MSSKRPAGSSACRTTYSCRESKSDKFCRANLGRLCPWDLFSRLTTIGSFPPDFSCSHLSPYPRQTTLELNLHLELATQITMLARIQPASSESAQAPGSSSSGAGPSAKFSDFMMQAQRGSSTSQPPASSPKNFNGPTKPAPKKSPESQLPTSIPALTGVPVNPSPPALPQAASQALVSGPDQAPLAGATFPTILGAPTVPQFSPADFWTGPLTDSSATAFANSAANAAVPPLSAAPKEAHVPADSAAGKPPAVASTDAWPPAGSFLRDTMQNELVAQAVLSEIGTKLSKAAVADQGKAIAESASGSQPGTITTQNVSTDPTAGELTTQNRAST